MSVVTTDIHPDAVLESMLAKAERSNRRSNLTKMHEVCRKHHATGSRDFSLPTIGRLAEAEGILKGRALYNAGSADYKTLIEAWAAYAGPPSPKAPKTLEKREYLKRIEDPAIRAIMQAVIVERDKLKTQLDTLKANTQLTVDRRPAAPSQTLLSSTEQLTASELEALQKAVNPGYLEQNGMKEGSRGEILTDLGRRVFDVGFASAVRKLLGDIPRVPG